MTSRSDFKFMQNPFGPGGIVNRLASKIGGVSIQSSQTSGETSAQTADAIRAGGAAPTPIQTRDGNDGARALCVHWT